MQYAIKKHGAKKPGMILINNPWGESNEKGLKEALEAFEAGCQITAFCTVATHHHNCEEDWTGHRGKHD